MVNDNRISGRCTSVKQFLTIVICSYNYEHYVAQTIDSALAQDPLLTRVVVIDDGSTDGSRAVIESYGDRIDAIFKINGGQASAYNDGLALVETPYVLFLDSDDILYEGAAARIVGSFESGDYVKVQYRLDVIAQDGTPMGVHVPHSPAPDNCTELVRQGWLYPSPPASGNAYRVSALRRLFPIPRPKGRGIAADFFAIYGVALLGTVASIDTALGGYRVHRPAFADENGRLPPVGLSIANCQNIDDVVNEFPQRWAVFREWIGERIGVELPLEVIDFSYEKARLCAGVYEKDFGVRVKWLLFESRCYFASIFSNPFWGAGKKLAAVALTLACIFPSGRMSDRAVRYIANPLSRRTGAT
jgi:glycosyltransferase involved in cell wall biosynthesis